MSPSSSHDQLSAPAPAVLKQEQPIQMEQPRAHMAMDPMQPHPNTEVNLRGGGQRGGLCPGRFCFCVPCPLPCDCCVIPL